jgi:organic hydroperoxide reductase OsmC/OhrA
MGTLATVLAGKKILTTEDKYWAEVEGDIEDVNGILKITRIRVNYHLRLLQEKIGEAKEAFSLYLPFCPAAQSVIGCIDVRDDLIIEQ